MNKGIKEGYGVEYYENGQILFDGYWHMDQPIGENIKVNFSLSLLEIEPHEQTNTFTSRISYTRTWFDERLMYKHLKRDAGGEMNALFPGEMDLIWYPSVIFYNMKNKMVKGM